MFSPRKTKDNESPTASHVILFFGDVPPDGPSTYIGDVRPFNDVFAEGFKGAGADQSLVTDMSKTIAMSSPVNRETKYMFLYEINPGRSVSYRNMLDHLLKSGNMTHAEYDLRIKEQTLLDKYLISGKIEPHDIRGAWRVECGHDLDRSNGNIIPKRKLLEPFIPNPNHKPFKTPDQKAMGAAKALSNTVTYFAIYCDGSSLSEKFIEGMSNDNYVPFLEETARVVTAWTSAWAMGAAGAEIGSLLGIPGTVIGGAVGSAVGYVVGGELSANMRDFRGTLQSVINRIPIFIENALIPRLNATEIDCLTESARVPQHETMPATLIPYSIARQFTTSLLETPVDPYNAVHHYFIQLALNAQKHPTSWQTLPPLLQQDLLTVVSAHHGMKERPVYVNSLAAGLQQRLDLPPVVERNLPHAMGVLFNALDEEVKFSPGVSASVLQNLSPTVLSESYFSQLVKLPLATDAAHFLQVRIKETFNDKRNQSSSSTATTTDIDHKEQQLLQQLSQSQTALSARVSKLQTNMHAQQQRTEQILRDHGVAVEAMHQDLVTQLTPLFAFVEQEKQHQQHKQAMANMQGIHDAFGAIGQLGRQFNAPEIMNIATVGQCAVTIISSVGQLTGTMGFTAASGAAMLTPTSLAVVASLTLINTLFGSEKDGLGKALQAIMEQIQALHMEMRASFNQVFENQKLIFSHVAAVLYGINKLDFKVNFLQAMTSSGLTDIHSLPFITLHESIKKDRANEFILTDTQRQKAMATLSEWLDLHLKSATQTKLVGHYSTEQIVTMLSTQPCDDGAIFPVIITHLMGLFDDFSAQAAGLERVNLTLYMNTALFFIHTATHYTQLKNNYIPCAQRTKHTLQQALTILEKLEKSHGMVDRLLRQYQELRYRVGRAICVVRKDTQSKSLPQDITLGALAEYALPNNKNKLHDMLNELEMRRLLLHFIARLTHLSQDIQDKIARLVSKQHILQLSRNEMMQSDIRLLQAAQRILPDEFESALLDGADINYRRPVSERCETDILGEPMGWGAPIHYVALNGYPKNPMSLPFWQNARQPSMLHLLFKDAENLQHLVWANTNSEYQAWPNTWPYEIYVVEILGNTSCFMGLILYSAMGFDVQESMRHLMNLYWWANNHSAQAIVTKYMVREMIKPDGVINRNDLRKAYQYYQQVAAGASPDSSTINPRCVLWLVCILGDLRVLSSLGAAAKTIDVNQAIPECLWTPLMMAFTCRQQDVIRYLLDAGANVKARFAKTDPHRFQIDDRADSHSPITEPTSVIYLIVTCEQLAIIDQLIADGLELDPEELTLLEERRQLLFKSAIEVGQQPKITATVEANTPESKEASPISETARATNDGQLICVPQLVQQITSCLTHLELFEETQKAKQSTASTLSSHAPDAPSSIMECLGQGYSHYKEGKSAWKKGNAAQATISFQQATLFYNRVKDNSGDVKSLQKEANKKLDKISSLMSILS